MIRFIDSVVLAYTKLRTHRIRTAIVVCISGLLFGLILAVIFVSQGVFESFQKFSKEGLSGRAIVAVTHISKQYNVTDNLEEEKLIALVEARHKEITDKKAAAAKKFLVPYNAAIEDPLPIEVDSKTGRKSLGWNSLQNEAVTQIATELTEKQNIPFDINEYLRNYKSARILTGNSDIRPDYFKGESFLFMKDGRDTLLLPQSEQEKNQNSSQPTLMTGNETVTKPFINTSVAYDPKSGALPVILPFSSAEEHLGLKKLPNEATTSERLERLKEVRNRVGEIKGAYCYRNGASQQLVSTAIAQADDAKRNAGDRTYIAPSLQYKLPAVDSCGAVEVTKDTRTAAEKRVAENFVQYQKEIGEYPGEPKQFKVLVQGVGVSGDATVGMQSFDVAGMVQEMMQSWIAYDQTWVIPAGMLKEVPQEYLPGELFENNEDASQLPYGRYGGMLSGYLVEFDNVDEARALLRAAGMFGGSQGSLEGAPSASPYGSGMLIIEELKQQFTTILLWGLLILGGVAVVILGSIVARTVSEGRRESAVFRAIGARRIDIASIYGVYALLLSLRIMFFALILGLAIAVTIELLFGGAATLGAQYAYAASDLAGRFSLMSVTTWLVPLTLGSIIVAGVAASIIPVIYSARRNPIKDMRDDT